jgi:hypothetical protein
VVFENEYIMWCLSAEWIARNGCALRWVVSADKLRKLWDSLSELRSSLCERRLERTVLRPALLPIKTAQFIQFYLQVWRHTVKSLSLTERVWRALYVIACSFISRTRCNVTLLPLILIYTLSCRCNVPLLPLSPIYTLSYRCNVPLLPVSLIYTLSCRCNVPLLPVSLIYTRSCRYNVSLLPLSPIYTLSCANQRMGTNLNSDTQPKLVKWKS